MVAEGVLEILVHPLVLLNISDYYTRLRLISETLPRVAGICLGTQDGRHVSIETTFELLLDHEADGSSHCNLAYLEAKLDQYKQVFPTLEAVGWYTIGAEIEPWEMSLQDEFSTRFDGLLLLLLNPELLDAVDQNKASDLPLKVFESQMGAILPEGSTDTALRHRFHELGWKLDTSEAERIAVDHVAKAQTTTNNDIDEADRYDKSLISHYTAQANAIKMLSSRISLLKAYVEDVEAGKVAADATVLRRINALLQRVPLMQSPAFASEFKQEQGDVLLSHHLSEIMKGSLGLSNLTDTYAMMASKGKKTSGMAGGWI